MKTIRWMLVSLFLTWLGVAHAGNPEALWQAARDGDLEAAAELLEAGVPVDAKSEFDCTALYFAANNNRPKMIAFLASKGADVDVRDNDYGYSALGMAAWLGHAEAIEALLDAGASKSDGMGSLFAAATQGQADAVRVLVRRLELQATQLAPVAAAASNAGQSKIVDLLVELGAAKPAATAAPAATTTEPSTITAAKPRGQRPEVERPAPWPEFRGAGRTGIADGQLPPLEFDLASGRNVLWRTTIDGLGYSSPVVWGKRIFVTTATSESTKQTIDDQGLGWIAAVPESVPHRFELHAYDLHSGALLWKRVAHEGVPTSERHWKASQANPTVTTDGEVVIASFGSEGLFAYDLDGKLLWKRELGELNAGWYIDASFEWGFASSPILYGNKVIVQADIHGRSFVGAYDRKSGKPLWRTEREEIPSWGTPVVYQNKKRDELILAATGAVIGYDPANGKELWRIRGNSTITVASPLAQDGLIVATGGYRDPRPIYVLRPGAEGDVTPEENGSNDDVLWSRQGDGVYVVTPLLYRGVLYMLRGNGVLTAWDAESGEQLYRERVGGNYTASLVAADGKLYLTAEEGDVRVVAAGSEFKLLAESQLDASILATPAISDGVMLFRTVRGLVGVGSSQPSATAR